MPTDAKDESPDSPNQPPPRVWINPRPPRTLEDQLHDGGIWHYDGAPDDIPYVPEAHAAALQAQLNALTDARCVHCDPSFVPNGSDGWCHCACHSSAEAKARAREIMSEFYHPDGVRKLRGHLTRRNELKLIEERIAAALSSTPSISAAIAVVERLRDEWRKGASWEGEEYADGAEIILTALRALQPSS